MQLQFAEFNFADITYYTTRTVTLSARWTAADKGLLYDHISSDQLATAASTDSLTDTITIDLQAQTLVTLIKLINCNFREYDISLSTDDVTYVSYKSDTDNSSSTIIWDAAIDEGVITEAGYVLTESGEYVLDETSGLPIELELFESYRYIKISATKTFLQNSQKLIGELYIGRKAIEITEGKALLYQESFSDSRGSSITNYKGLSQEVRVRSNFSASITVSRPSKREMTFIKDAVRVGGVYDFFPTSSLLGDELDNSLSIDDIYLVEAAREWSYQPYGAGAKGLINFTLREAYIAS